MLQQVIAYGNRHADEAFNRLMASNFGHETGKEMSLYTRVCREDERVAGLVAEYGLSGDDLADIYVRLKLAGLDQWINGRHVALSTIADAEPLEFFLQSERRKISTIATSTALLEYWEGRIRKGTLLDYLGK